jgi:ABC-type polysaccharide/polyol phosphate transport system ATPase subunit
MSDVVIRAEGLGKRYYISHETDHGSYTALRDVLAGAGRGLLRSALNIVRDRSLVSGSQVEEFWALKDVSFEIKRGEAVGIIGRNGAGKSTLLKILSRITEPSAGRVQIKGRVASLLEVGTGFHGELTGRENIFLNGAILGMSRAEIKRKFDEIVAFAEVEKFLDTPVKRYSSGMYVRLAFAVAAHLEPEILVVDEVLAVGDTEFQKKCLGKMQDMAGHGRTVLFVSHSLSSISALTQKCAYLASGLLVKMAPTREVVDAYLSVSRKESLCYQREVDIRKSKPYIHRISIKTSSGSFSHETGDPLSIFISFVFPSYIRNACFRIFITDSYGRSVVQAHTFAPESPLGHVVGTQVLECYFPNLKLNVGSYSLDVWLTEPPNGEIFEHLPSVLSFEVVRTDKTVLWDWQPSACTYFEDFEWREIKGAEEAARFIHGSTGSPPDQRVQDTEPHPEPVEG